MTQACARAPASAIQATEKLKQMTKPKGIKAAVASIPFVWVIGWARYLPVVGKIQNGSMKPSVEAPSPAAKSARALSPAPNA
jgi:hypothetical protein